MSTRAMVICAKYLFFRENKMVQLNLKTYIDETINFVFIRLKLLNYELCKVNIFALIVKF